MKTNIKYLVKSILPNWALNFARKINGIFSVKHYWPAYVFKNGRADNLVSIALELTYRCNLNCAMCPQAMDLHNPESVLRTQMEANKELKTSEIINIVNQAKQIGVKRFTLTGGEPFIRRDILEIIDAIKSHQMESYIISNGGLIREQHVKEIVKIGVNKITFSLDGPEALHNEIRGNKTIYSNLINAVKMIQTEKSKQKKNVPDLTFNMTISALNANRMSEMVEIAAQEKVNINYGYVFYTSKEMEERTREVMLATGGKMEDQDIPRSIRDVDVESLAKEIQKTEKLATQLGVKVNIQPYLKNIDDLHNRFYNDSFAYVNHCFYPWYAMRVNPYGEVYPCQMNIKMGSVRENRLDELWNNEKYIEFRKKLRRVGIWPKCAKCCKLNDKLWDNLPKFQWYWEKK